MFVNEHWLSKQKKRISHQFTAHFSFRFSSLQKFLSFAISFSVFGLFHSCFLIKFVTKFLQTFQFPKIQKKIITSKYHWTRLRHVFKLKFETFFCFHSFEIFEGKKSISSIDCSHIYSGWSICNSNLPTTLWQSNNFLTVILLSLSPGLFITEEGLLSLFFSLCLTLSLHYLKVFFSFLLKLLLIWLFFLFLR